MRRESKPAPRPKAKVRKPSSIQKRVLADMGVPLPVTATYDEAAELIRKVEEMEANGELPP